MSKTPSTKLFRLIKSLSSSEKRYFKVFVNDQGSKDNKYIRLFDAMDAQQEFDEEVLKTSIYEQEEIHSQKYSELKAYLYEWVIKSLQSYDEKASIDHQLKLQLQGVRALFRRSLYEDSKDLLARIKKQAYRYEQFITVLEVLIWEKQIAYAESNIDFLDRELERIDAEEKAVLEQLRNLSEYRNVFFRLLVSLRKDASLRSEANREKLKHIVESPLLLHEENANSHQARILYYRIMALYYYATNDPVHYYEKSKTLIGLMESRPYFLKEDVSEYISALNNLIISCGQLSKIAEIEQNLEKLFHVQPKSRDDEFKIHRQYYQNKLSLCILKGDFQEGMKVMERHLKEVTQFDQNLFETPTFYYIYFYISFGSGAYDRALAYLNHWLNMPGTVERQDLQSMARILNLIIHYELGNFVLLESLIRSTYRFLKKRNKLHEMEREIIAFIRKAIETPSKKELKETFIAMRSAFESLSQGALKQSFFTEAISAWLDSKIESTTFAQIIQRRFQRSGK